LSSLKRMHERLAYSLMVSVLSTLLSSSNILIR
jgi:hypothetical protein